MVLGICKAGLESENQHCFTLTELYEFQLAKMDLVLSKQVSPRSSRRQADVQVSYLAIWVI